MQKITILILLMAVAAVVTAQQVELPEGQRTGLIGWFDAADETAFVLQGNQVRTWRDKSGAGHDAHADATGAGPTHIMLDACAVVQANNRPLLAAEVNQILPAMTVYALLQVPPAYTPIISFRRDDKMEFLAAGWTIGARPTLHSSAGSADAMFEVEDNQWHILTFVRDGAQRRFYVDGVPAGGKSATDTPLHITDYHLFAYKTAATYAGRLAELLLYRDAHDAGTIAAMHEYLREKWRPLFRPPEQDLVAFVGNSITTGMYCGNGKTWSSQSARQLPQLTHWYNLSRGGITTQGLAALAPDSLDPLLKSTTARSVLIFWEGTNDLVVNRASAEAAHEAIQAYCRARREAGWQRIIVMTVLPRESSPAFEEQRQRLNVLLRAHYSDYADALADIAAHPEIGEAGDEKNREYYADGVHTTARGNEIIAGVVLPHLRAMLDTE